MDGIVRKKQKTHIDREHSYDFLAHAQQPKYHILELGRVYHKHSDFSARFSTDSAPHDRDPRAILATKASDFSVGPIPQHQSLYADNYMPSYDMPDEENVCTFDDMGRVRFALTDVPIFAQQTVLHPPHVSRRFMFAGALVMCMVSFGLFVGTVFAVKKHVFDAGEQAVASMKAVMEDVQANDLVALSEHITQAHDDFTYASQEFDRIHPAVTFVSRFTPWTSQLSSGDHMVEAGKYLSHTAMVFGEVLPTLIENGQGFRIDNAEETSFLTLYTLLADRFEIAHDDIANAQKHLDYVYLDDVPEAYQETFMELKALLPDIHASLSAAVTARPAIEDLLGANGPRTYLLLFQNNQEMRATGGFIGSYGIIKINNGTIEKIFVDDIYNPDGQLIDKIVPPRPIQKISANWSLHDSNWFVDFPVSAKKSMDFYERTGGPTVHGVIAMTPTMIEKLLTITGPITIESEGITVTSENFVAVMQNEVEDRDNYVTKDTDETNETDARTDTAHNAHRKSEIQKDNTLSTEDDDTEMEEKEKPHPKKALAEMMPILVDRLLSDNDPKKISQLFTAVSDGVKERHILLYSSQKDIQNIIAQNGWGGAVLQTDRDYLSVINTNINGFKTDGVIDEVIDHTAHIAADGSIVDTVKITRTHHGGTTGEPWWDAVNADYMRVYVPEGSTLLSVEGQTREINPERLDYDALAYKRDADVQKEEQNMTIDDETGTRIYTEYGKTVFANWVYVSPQETVTITYTYRLPFQIDLHTGDGHTFGSYAALFQKQSGSTHSTIQSHITLDERFEYYWHAENNDTMDMTHDLHTDRYNGVVFVER